MTTTNGASLEDCLTNIFSLIDLEGIRWKRFLCPNYHGPIDTHPILNTYAKCLEENHIAVWRHEPQKRHQNAGGPGGGQTGPGRTSNNNTPTGAGPNLSATVGGNAANQQQSSNNQANKQQNYELWIFGYAHQLKVDDVVGDDLTEIEDDNWETKGLSYECRILLFRALHNLIERCLIGKGFTRIGRWFVQPMTGSSGDGSSSYNSYNLYQNHQQQHHLAAAAAAAAAATASAATTSYPSSAKPSKHIKLEQHGSIKQGQSTNPRANLSAHITSNLKRIIHDSGQDFDSRQSLDKSDGLRHTTNRSCSTYFTSNLDGTKLSLSFAFSFFVHGDSTVCATVDVRQHPLVHPLTRSDLNALQDGGIVRVALAPFGLNGILNGVNYKDSDNGAATTAFIQQWSKFYPLPKTRARLISSTDIKSSAATTGNSAMTGNNQFDPRTPSDNNQTSRSYLSNLTNMLLPPTSKPNLQCNYEPHEVPPIVEVIVAGYRMRYPSECVFTTSKVVDLYKSLDLTLNPRATIPQASKKLNKSSSSKPNKLSLLIEKLADDKQVSPMDISQTKIKIEPDINNKTLNDSPFRLTTDTVSSSKVGAKTLASETITKEFANAVPSAKDIVNQNGCLEMEGISNTTSIRQTNTISRFSNSTATRLGSNNTPLGPNDLVKLFPTPPSLEQIILSPAALSLEEQLATGKEQTILSPPNQIISSSNDQSNEIDVYKPVECALMPPPPKWAALTSIVISSTKSLPPQCIYKKSSLSSISKMIPSKVQEVNNKLNSSRLSSSNIKQIDSPMSRNLQSSSLFPLTDQTNKSSSNMNSIFHSSSNASPKPPATISGNSLLSGSLINSTSMNNTTTISTIHPPTSIATATTVLSTAFTLPHQRLFNNLNEINSIQLNLMISDTDLGMFQDHNFENCTLCVCNMTTKSAQIESLPHRGDANTSGGHSWRPSVGNDSTMSPTPNRDYANECTCGFSAIKNRHCSHLSGLFFEDELELTNVLYDPTEMIDQNKVFRKIRLSDYSENAITEEQKLMSKLSSEMIAATSGSTVGGGGNTKTGKGEINVIEETKLFVIDQLKQQCAITLHPNSSLSKVLLVESFRNNRHLTSCTNYYAQTTVKQNTGSPLHRILDDSVKYTTVKLMNRNPLSLKFSDFCELTKNVICKLGNQSPSNSLSGSLVKPLGVPGAAGLSSIFSRMFYSTRKSIDIYSNTRNNLFAQGLQTLVVPTLSIDPKGALQVLEELVREDSKEALATLNKAILIFSSPVHDWQFITAPIPENNLDVTNLLKILQPSLDESIGSHNKLYKDYVHQQQQHIFSARDSPTGAPVVPTPPCQGPLTWRQFHQSSGRGTEDQCEPQPIPTLLVGHHVEKNHLALSPFALKFWDKLSLEPYAPGHNMFYLVISPNNQSILEHVITFFKELSNTYELMKLGKHVPIGDTGGVILANNQPENSDLDDKWFADLKINEKEAAGQMMSQLKNYAAKMGQTLAKAIADFMDERQPPYDPHADRFESSPTIADSKAAAAAAKQQQQQNSQSRTFNSLFGISNTNQPTDLNTGSNNFGGLTNEQNHVQSDQQGNHLKSQTLIGGSSTHGGIDDNIHLEDELTKQNGIVIYLIDPFSSPSVSQNLRMLSTMGLFRCYLRLIEHLPESLRVTTQLQLVSLDSVVSNSRPIFNISKVDQLKSLSMNVYSRCRKIMANQITAKTLTGFGPAAALEAFFKTKNPEYSIAKVFTPPYILAPTKDKQTELGEMFGDRREKSSVLFCSYCITEDQRWLLVSVTNERGEISETSVININISERMKRPKMSVRSVALKKMMEFIVSVMSDWTNPWRLVIGKVGRVGHGELKEWASLLSKRSLLNYSRLLTERCRQCTIIPATETVSILSACLVSLEPDSKLRIMPDQFTIDDRNASFNKCPLSTPEDASATHILVFPTSASIHAAQGNAEDPALTSGLDDDLLQSSLLEDEDLAFEGGFNDLFGDVWPDAPGDVADNVSGAHHDNMTSSSNFGPSGGGNGGDSSNNQDEPLQLLQQPLALGYYMSTAKIGQMPNWFWSTNPHLRNSCPVFLKSALHFHMPSVQLQDDYVHSDRPKKSHQLDSNLTTDVLRYVLEGYNSLSWLALNPKTYDRQSCLPVHMQNLLQLYHLMESFS